MQKLRIHKEEIKKALQKKYTISILSIVIEWFIVLFTFYFCIIYPFPITYLMGGLLISTRMNAFYSLAHEACHYQISKNKKLNDLIANLLLAWPIFIDIKKMRKLHFAHHKYLQTEKDPEIAHLKYDEFQFPLQKKKIFSIFFKDLIGYNFLSYKLRGGVIVDFNNPHRLLYYVLMLAMLFYFQLVIPFILLWILPYIGPFQLLNRIRLYSEHFNLPEGKIQIRTLHLSKWKAFFLVPYGLGYHAEHHFYPAVPFYNLRKLHIKFSKEEQ